MELLGELKEYLVPLKAEENLLAFREIIWRYYDNHRRAFPWRETISPYTVLVSEVMLQQTQCSRVAKQFPPFITAFPDFAALAQAPFSEILRLWKGLGYNRRAMNLQKVAALIMDQHQGVLPKDIDELQKFPGIGKATARSIFTFAFDAQSVFIETNIRTVFLFYFFQGRTTKVHDREIEAWVAKTLDADRPRDWYYALMDFGVLLKKNGANLNHQSVHYKAQSKFTGSDRQLRGKILDFLLKNSDTERDLAKYFVDEEPRFSRILDQLCNEGLVKKVDGLCTL